MQSQQKYECAYVFANLSNPLISTSRIAALTMGMLTIAGPTPTITITPPVLVA